MWIVKNTLRATLSFRGLDVAIAPGEEFDLDVLGRGAAETSNQVLVALEEGYLENVYKAPAGEPQAGGGPVAAPGASQGISREDFKSGLDSFKTEVLQELRQHLPGLNPQDQEAALSDLRSALSADMQELVGELKLVRDRFASVKGRIQSDPSLSDAEVRARLAFLDEQERELLKNFESVGRQVESEGGDVMDKADLLSNL